jgi:hypothetical protein
MSKPKVNVMYILLSAVACALAALPALADSQARIVRLSDVQGTVQIDKNSGMGFENAFMNLPITQGTRLRTSNSGRAEIEFEDGSTLRLAPDTVVDFSRLGRTDAGQMVSDVNLTEGKIYVNWLGKNDDFTLNFSREKVELNHAAHFRVETSTKMATFAVFKGDVDVTGPSGEVKVSKKKAVTFDVSDQDKYASSKFQEDPLDAWDKRSIEYHDQYAKGNPSPYGYGYSDLNYYGSFMNVAGYGTMWQPFFSGVGWSPFADGAWSFYPGYGYLWASAYPWGWMPFHYGTWMFVSGAGWMWQPGGFNSWRGVPSFAGTMPVGFRPVVVPSGSVSTVVVGRGGFTNSNRVQSSLFVNRGSAGLGVPRGAVSNLGHLNGQVAKSGAVELRPVPSAAANRSSGSGFGQSRSAPSSPAMSHGTATAAHTSGGHGHN